MEVGTDKIAEEKITYVKFGDHATAMPSTVRYANKVNGKYLLLKIIFNPDRFCPGYFI